MEIELIRTSPEDVLAKVTLTVKEVYANYYPNIDGSSGEGADPPLTKEQVQKDFLSKRDMFRPYDEPTESFFGVTEEDDAKRTDEVQAGIYWCRLWIDDNATYPLRIYSCESMQPFSFTPRQALDLLELLQNYQGELIELAEHQEEDELNEETEQENED